MREHSILGVHSSKINVNKSQLTLKIDTQILPYVTLNKFGK